MTYVRLTQEQISALAELVSLQPNTELNQSIKSTLDDKVEIIFAITEDDIKNVAQELSYGEDEQYSEDDIDKAIKVIDHGNIDFDWYETVDDVLESVRNF